MLCALFGPHLAPRTSHPYYIPMLNVHCAIWYQCCLLLTIDNIWFLWCRSLIFCLFVFELYFVSTSVLEVLIHFHTLCIHFVNICFEFFFVIAVAANVFERNHNRNKQTKNMHTKKWSNSSNENIVCTLVLIFFLSSSLIIIVVFVVVDVLPKKDSQIHPEQTVENKPFGLFKNTSICVEIFFQVDLTGQCTRIAGVDVLSMFYFSRDFVSFFSSAAIATFLMFARISCNYPI